jgi:hypothetical protein
MDYLIPNAWRISIGRVTWPFELTLFNLYFTGLLLSIVTTYVELHCKALSAGSERPG